MESKASDKKTFSGKNFSDVDHFVNSSGQCIFCRYWKPESEPKAMIMIVHGLGEHSGRHAIIARMFTEMGLLVFCHDHAGHGESEGYHLDLVDYKQYLADMLQHCKLMQEKHPSLPLFVFGHSMGGALATLFVHQNPDVTDKVVISSPMLVPDPQMTSFKVFMAKWLSPVVPRVAVAMLDTNAISRIKEEVDRYNTDPLNYHGKILSRTGYQLYLIMDEVAKITPNIKFTFLVLHGEADGLCQVSGSKNLFAQAKSTDKEMKIFPGGYHELVHDEKETSEEFLSCIRSWLEKRM